MDQALNIYNTYVFPFLTTHKRQARVSISAAIGLLTLYWAYDKIFRPPRQLRGIPQAPFFGILKALFTSKPIDELARITLPVANKSPSGLYMRFDQNGWNVRITRPESAKKFLLKTDLFVKDSVSKSRKETLGGRFIFSAGNILTLNGQDWKMHRKVANPAFHRSMPIDLFGKLTKKMIYAMDQAKGPIEFHNMTSRITLDAIGLAGFGFDFNAIGDENNEWTKMYGDFTVAQRNPVFFMLTWLDQEPLLRLFPKRRKAHQDLTKFLNKLDEIIIHKRQVLEGTIKNDQQPLDDRDKDLLTLMLEAQQHDGEAVMTNEELKSNLCVFFLAGHDTTANALNFAVYYMAMNKDIQEKAREEAIRVLGDNPEDVIPNSEQVKSLPYIDMVIKETLRMNPPASAIFARKPTEDTDLDGVFIPKGQSVALDIYQLHHNPTVWKDPEVFDPERFSPGGEYDQLSTTGMPWLPFSSGSRVCIGMNFSMDEQRVVLSMLLRKYEWDLPQDSPHRKKLMLEGLGLTKAKNMFVQFDRRY
ncbi:cytochrome p450 [Lichtheimia corymbifera JMRC:FSU:9682]|uniref:Cytochrome p450 n=1 Tax=Lichtheimia corymbifera JMRC:FSU:9682 TaxID=1263082 RepID=A0A068SEW5_9FUNG|nr:cytochrome p450 [Lichtheimia corymbifera JMRC:FSU:9682]